MGDKPEITEVRPGPQELLRGMAGGQLYREAAGRGRNLSVHLEELDPTARYDGPHHTERLDAFGRLMKAAGIKTVSDGVRGYWADTFAAFDQSDATRALIPEWAARRWREARTGVSQNPRAEWKVQGRAAAFTSADEGLGTVARPYFDEAAARASILTPDIRVADLVALETPIEGDAYRAAYMTDPAADDIRKFRVGEAADIPLARITSGQHDVRIYKYGRGFEVTYEYLRRQRIDKVGFWIARAALQEEDDKVSQALDTLINGDGNGNAATAYNISTITTGQTAGTTTLRAWLAFKLKFNRGYALDTIIGQEASLLDLLTLNTGSANQPLAVAFANTFGNITPFNRRLSDGVRAGVSADAPSSTIVGIDTRIALEHATEIGSNISETERFVQRQTQIFVMTEVEGFSVLDQRATRLLNVAA